MTVVIDGKKLAQDIRVEIKAGVDKFRSERKRDIGLAVVLVGDNPASQVYVRNKIKQDSLASVVKRLATDKNIDGILVQLPLPEHLDAEKILKLIPTEKDVDGFSEENTGKLSRGEDCLVACTPNGIMKILERYGVETCGKKAVVVGRSDIVGKPMAMLLINADATVTVCHSKTADLKEECLRADILVAAVGKTKFITADMVKEGATVIDVGMNRNENGKLCGDVDFENVKDKCSYITPVPGGVGPMTITMLMYNTLQAALRR